MAEGVTKAQLKREISNLSQDLYNINLHLQQIRQGQPHPHQTEMLEHAKLQIQKRSCCKRS